MIGSPICRKKEKNSQKEGDMNLRNEYYQPMNRHVKKKFGGTHPLAIQGILSYPEIIGACCAITANMLVIRKFPGLEPGVGAVREPPLRMLAAGPLFPARGRGKSLGPFPPILQSFCQLFISRSPFPLQ